MSDTGIIFNLQPFSIHDGRGIRTSVFFKGCPLRCRWCSNPESQLAGPQLYLDESLCLGCGNCAEACSRGAAVTAGGRAEINRSVCDLCGACVKDCPTGALSFWGRVYTREELLTEIERDRPFYRRSGGGVTFTGGEPLAQAPFLTGLLDSCRERGIHTALETCGYGVWENVRPVFARVDEIFIDLKDMDPNRHRELTGLDNTLILANIRELDREDFPFTLRLPVVPEVNFLSEGLEKLGAFASSLRQVRALELLPYHRLGTHKYKGLGLDYSLAGTQPPGREEMEAAAGRLRRACRIPVLYKG